MTIHRIVEMECGFTPALEFLPGLKGRGAGGEQVLALPIGNGCRRQPRAVHPVHMHREDARAKPSWSIAAHRQRQGPCSARPLWHQKKKDDAFMRGLAAAGLTVGGIGCRHVHASPCRSCRLERGWKRGRRWVPSLSESAPALFSKTELDYWLAENDKATIAADRRQRDSHRRGEALRPGHQRPCAGRTRWGLLPTTCPLSTTTR